MTATRDQAAEHTTLPLWPPNALDGCGPELPLGSALHETAHLRQTTDEESMAQHRLKLACARNAAALSHRNRLGNIRMGGVRKTRNGGFWIEGAASGCKECAPFPIMEVTDLIAGSWVRYVFNLL